MFSADLNLVKTVMDLKIEETLRRAERRRVLLQAGLSQGVWFSRHGGQLLGHLGDALVALGRWLQRYRTAQYLSLGSAQALHHD